MAIENIGNLVPTKIPGYSDDADIQEALRIYHYGATTIGFDINETDPLQLPSPSMAKTIYDIQTDIASIENTLLTTINSTSFSTKGEILTASADNTIYFLPPAANGKFLSTNSATTSGLEWIDFPTSFNTLTANSINVSGNVVSHISTIEKTESYTPTVGDISDDGKLIEFNSFSSHTYTIPTNANNPYPIGTQISVLQTNTGQTTISPANGVTLYCTPQPVPNTAKLRTRWSSVTLIKRSTNIWVAIGDLSAA